MKRTNTFTLAALALLSLAGCTQDDERTAAGLPMTGMPLHPVVDVDAPVTREAMTTETLDHYYFRVTDQEEAATTGYDYFVEMTKGEDGTWSLADGYEEMTWQSTFPRVSAMEQKDETWDKEDYINGKDITLPTDQSKHENLLKSDVLYMAPTDVTAEGLDDENNIKVNLKHLFAKLKVVVTLKTKMPEGVTPTNPIKSLVVGGTKTQARFTPETGELGTVSGEATTITACQDGTSTTYECILLPQTVDELTVTAYLDEAQSQKKAYTHPSTLTLQGNTQYTLSLTMDHEGKLAPSDSVGVGNWGNQDIGGGELEEGAEITYDEYGPQTYTVSTARGLLQWAEAVQINSDINLTLTKDIDMEGKTWPTIKYYTYATIDGGGHTIKNLAITGENVNKFGLIAGNATNCNIRNLTLLNPSIDVSDFTGGFLVHNAGETTMENCHVIGGTTNNGDYTGGLAYNANNSSFTACSVTSSGVDMICTESTVIGEPCSITACYVNGGNSLVGK